MAITGARPDRATHYLVRAAVTAPSAFNTQPWRFAYCKGELHLCADTTRRLRVADPEGRELLISCGAALFNVRLAMLHLGFRARVRLLPVAADPWLLATVSWGPYARASYDDDRMFRAMELRHTHRGPFQPDPLPAVLIDELREQARREGADLYAVAGAHELRRLAELIGAAEDVHRRHPGLTAERANWAPGQGSGRLDGVPGQTYPRDPDTVAFAGRDYAGRARLGYLTRPAASCRGVLGLPAVVHTRRDGPHDWLRAGQALQRVLLHAAAQRVAAAFHTQPLELPELRAQVERHVPGGGHPQLILRFGYVDEVRPSPRRPVGDVLAGTSRASATRSASPLKSGALVRFAPPC
ncbi:nitroreductase family protein [Streptomyces sp. TRM66268-LWL]|uniref:Nitroreductase family protein n=1 Tax=Streptomyces polyasparticus TaxID=2767826 RepID=A0ABR7SG01_9ACTN|nr:nitroreductase family protein [Streptomyces polyasparticus]MBC9713909.1 nitroreductase family protein [Streptomyces polyasparticus]